MGGGHKMNAKKILPISLQQIQMCLVVEEIGSFTKAAEQMYLAQPTLSKRIAEMEDALGVVIFDRKQGNKVTPAGNLLLRSGEKLIENFAGTLTIAEEVQNERGLVIGTVTQAYPGMLIRPAMRMIKSQYPDLHVKFALGDVPWLVKNLENGNLDLVLICSFRNELFFVPELQTEEIAQCRAAVAMLEGNPLTEKDELSVSDLNGQKLVMMKDEMLLEKIKSYEKQYSIELKNEKVVDRYAEIAVNVTEDDEIFLTNKFLGTYYNGDYQVRELCDLQETMKLLVSMRKNESRKSVLKCWKLLKQGIGEQKLR